MLQSKRFDQNGALSCDLTYHEQKERRHTEMTLLADLDVLWQHRACRDDGGPTHDVKEGASRAFGEQ